MKYLLKLAMIFFLAISCKTLENKNLASKSTVYFKINPEKTYVDNIGGIMLSFNIFNDSKKEIVILKPRDSFASRINFFTNTLECDDIPIWMSESEFKHLKVTKKDFLIIKPKTNIELLMNGRYYGMLACQSDSVTIQIKYEPSKMINTQGKYFEEMKEIIKTVTDINIYSDTLKFNLKKNN